MANLNFSGAHGWIQAVVQDIRTNKILRIGYVDKAAYDLMEEKKQVMLFDILTRQVVPVVGGEYERPLSVQSVIVNEAGDAIVIKALPEGSTTGADTFLGDKSTEDLCFLARLQDFIEKRRREMPEGSYTTKLFTKGINKITQKVGEEAVEMIIEATNGTKDQFIYEASDLIYHLIVLLTQMDVRIEDLARELKARHKE